MLIRLWGNLGPKTRIWASKGVDGGEGGEEEGKISPMCESIGHRPLWGPLPKNNKRGRLADRQTDKQTQTDKPTDRQTHKQTGRETQTDRQIDENPDYVGNRSTDVREIDGEITRRMHTQTHRRWRKRQTVQEKDREAGCQTDRQTKRIVVNHLLPAFGFLCLRLDRWESITFRLQDEIFALVWDEPVAMGRAGCYGTNRLLWDESVARIRFFACPVPFLQSYI